MGTTNNNGKDLAPRCNNPGTPVAALGPTAEFYKERVANLVVACAAAMRAGDIHLANELYERGVNAMANFTWHARLALMVGDLTYTGTV